MSFFSQFATGPAKVTTYTSGSGNYAPISVNQSWARVTVVAGGGGGAGRTSSSTAGSGGGGGGGARIEWIKLNEASYAYSVGAGGTGAAAVNDANSGSKSKFGKILAFGGSKGASTSGGAGGASNYTAAWKGNTQVEGYYDGGINGGCGGNSSEKGSSIGFSSKALAGGDVSLTAMYNTFAGDGAAGNNPGFGSFAGGGGGDSLYGTGGTGGNGSDGANANAGSGGTGYGGGGGGGGSSQNATSGVGGAGSGGIIIIEEFVQA